jgi:hypothetical protein
MGGGKLAGWIGEACTAVRGAGRGVRARDGDVRAAGGQIEVTGSVAVTNEPSDATFTWRTTM